MPLSPLLPISNGPRNQPYGPFPFFPTGLNMVSGGFMATGYIVNGEYVPNPKAKVLNFRHLPEDCPICIREIEAAEAKDEARKNAQPSRALRYRQSLRLKNR
jgi:hypothetical protein